VSASPTTEPSTVMSALATWTPLTLLAVLLGYTIAAAGLLLAPIFARLLREVLRARRDGRELEFDLFQPYPGYLLRYRRAVRLLLLPPLLLAGAWLWVRIV
jgi:hypothetical protein